MTTQNSPIFYVPSVVVAFDICHSTAILEDLTATESANQWRDVLIAIKEKLWSRRFKDGYVMYKFLGDGWILIFKESARPLDVLTPLAVVDSVYRSAYNEFVRPALQRKHPNPEITFGISRGRLVKFEMNRAKEFIGKPINEACRLQSAASCDGSGSRGVLSAGYYSQFRHELKHTVTPTLKKLRNLERGEEINCYKVDLRAAVNHVILCQA